jgi:tetratricopeptide (TPR) repeat protein
MLYSGAPFYYNGFHGNPGFRSKLCLFEKRPTRTLREGKMGKSANTQIWTESGIKLVLTNKKEAMVFFRQAIKLNPKSAAGFFDRGVSYQRLEKHDQAVSEYDRAIELDPQNFQAHFNRGVAHQALGNLEKAVQDFKRAVELKPDYAQAYLNRGKAFRQLQQFKQALGDFKIAARLGDLDAQAILDSMGISWKSEK